MESKPDLLEAYRQICLRGGAVSHVGPDFYREFTLVSRVSRIAVHELGHAFQRGQDAWHETHRVTLENRRSTFCRVFQDGTKELGGLRYCISSAAIRFVPKERMAAAGYSEWLKIFKVKEAFSDTLAKK